MSLIDEYRRQAHWRDWESVIARTPIRPGQRILDLGCAVGDIAAKLTERGATVLGVDTNEELLGAARAKYPMIRFEKQDLNDLKLPTADFDGIWSSFTTAYFVDVEKVAASWTRWLKPSAWVCLVDIDDLLGHEPLPAKLKASIQDFYEEAMGRYDFRVGSKLEGLLKSSGFEVQSFALPDRELSFSGVAQDDVVLAWNDRFARMGGLKNFLGQDFTSFVEEYIRCLRSPEHRSVCRVVCSIGRRNWGDS